MRGDIKPAKKGMSTGINQEKKKKVWVKKERKKRSFKFFTF